VVDNLAKAAHRRNPIWYAYGAMNALLNKTHVRKYSLHVADCHRPFAGFTRVSEEFLIRLEGKLRLIIESEIKSLPSKGITIK
jgi:hypothetical protein